MPDAENPVRAEFWGDEITDLSFFDIDTPVSYTHLDVYKRQILSRAASLSSTVSEQIISLNAAILSSSKNICSVRQLSLIHI